MLSPRLSPFLPSLDSTIHPLNLHPSVLYFLVSVSWPFLFVYLETLALDQPLTLSEVHGLQQPCQGSQRKSHSCPDLHFKFIVSNVCRAYHCIFLSALSSSRPISYHFSAIFNIFLQDSSH